MKFKRLFKLFMQEFIFIVYKKIRLGTDYLYYRVYDKIPDSDCFFALLFVYVIIRLFLFKLEAISAS